MKKKKSLKNKGNMGALLASLKSCFGGGGPAIEFDPHDNTIECCVTGDAHSQHSDSTISSPLPCDSFQTIPPERWEHDKKIASHSWRGNA